MDTILCSWCKKEKNSDEFGTKRNGERKRMCYSCLGVFKEYRDSHKGKKCQWCGAPTDGYVFCPTHRALMAERKRAKDALLPPRHCARCNNGIVPKGKQLCPACLVVSRKKFADERTTVYKARLLTIYKAYGGAQCVCCGESTFVFLSLDHINNDGNEFRRNLTGKGSQQGSGGRTHHWIIKNNFPPGFQVLCMNCNVGKHRNGGICPHQQQKVAA
jgi:hypothetical protein